MMFRLLIRAILASGFLIPVVHAERRVEFTPAGSPSLYAGSFYSQAWYYKNSGKTLNSFFRDRDSNKRVVHSTGWFEQSESGKRFYIRPNNSWLMSNCSRLVKQTDVQIRGFRINGKEANFYETDAIVSCNELSVSGYEFDQYLLITVRDVDELFRYFWDYSAVEVGFSLGRLEAEDLDFQLIFHAKDFRKNYKDLRSGLVE